MGAWIARTLIAQESMEAALDAMMKFIQLHVRSCRDCEVRHLLEDSIEEGRGIFYETLWQKERERWCILSTGDLGSELDSDSGCREGDLA